MGKNNLKAVALISGGLDSILAIQLLLEQGIGVTAVHFALPFCGTDDKGRNYSREIAERLGVSFRVERMGRDYLEVIRNPAHGHGSGLNPCIDCKIYMLRRAKEIADEIGAELVVTGEVLNQRPMSQHRIALRVIEKGSGLKGRLLRPLSAKFMEETIAEREGRVDRGRLLSIIGRGRKDQLALAMEKGILDFIPAAGGCLLTDKFYTAKLKDFLEHNKNAECDDLLILKWGRHFRCGGSKIIVGRNEQENENLLEMKMPGDYAFQLPDDIPGPVTILQGEKSKEAIDLAAALTLRYSDLKNNTAEVVYGENRFDRRIQADIFVQNNVEYYNITSGKKE